MDFEIPLKPEVLFNIGPFGITDTVVSTWAVMAVMIIGAIIFRIYVNKAYKAGVEAAPTGAANAAEMIVEGINGFTKTSIHSHWRPYAPYIGTIGIFLAIANTMGMWGFGLKPPTRDFHLPLALAVMSLSIFLVSMVVYKGVGGFLKHLLTPIPFFMLVEVGARLTSLTARLFGNVMAAFIIMEILIQSSEHLFSKVYILGPGFPALGSMYFDIFDGLLQAFVFTFLTTLYIDEAVGGDH